MHGEPGIKECSEGLAHKGRYEYGGVNNQEPLDGGSEGRKHHTHVRRTVVTGTKVRLSVISIIKSHFFGTRYLILDARYSTSNSVPVQYILSTISQNVQLKKGTRRKTEGRKQKTQDLRLESF